MEYKETAIEGVFIIEPKVFQDARGYFMEAWKQADFEEHIEEECYERRRMKLEKIDDEKNVDKQEEIKVQQNDIKEEINNKSERIENEINHEENNEEKEIKNDNNIEEPKKEKEEKGKKDDINNNNEEEDKKEE